MTTTQKPPKPRWASHNAKLIRERTLAVYEAARTLFQTYPLGEVPLPVRLLWSSAREALKRAEGKRPGDSPALRHARCGRCGCSPCACESCPPPRSGSLNR